MQNITKRIIEVTAQINQLLDSMDIDEVASDPDDNDWEKAKTKKRKYGSTLDNIQDKKWLINISITNIYEILSEEVTTDQPHTPTQTKSPSIFISKCNRTFKTTFKGNREQ